MSLSRLALIGLAMAAATPAFADDYWVYVGTYTGAKSKGIYRCRFDTATGTLSKPELAAEVVNPSFLAPNSRFDTLYCVGEVNGAKAGVSAFRMDAKTGGLKFLNTLPSGGDGPCHVAVSQGNQYASVANYGGGSCAFYQLADDGSLAKQIQFFQHEGHGPNKDRQEKAHAHCGAFSLTNLAFVPDLGLDRVKLYVLRDFKTGPTAEANGELVIPPGTGPRHIALAPTPGRTDTYGELAFVCGELDSTVHVLRLTLDDLHKTKVESYKVEQTISTLPGGKSVPGNSTAEVLLHPSGKFLYVSNRGHNSIATFAWDGKELRVVGHTTDGIKTPRNFNVTPDGKWMLVASQDGDTVRVFAIDPNSGLPKPTEAVVEVGKPVCVKFVPVAK
jgi:6-phosphogluconolactonase